MSCSTDGMFLLVRLLIFCVNLVRNWLTETLLDLRQWFTLH